LVVVLEDGTRHAVSLDLFPILADSTMAERLHWELIGGGLGVHWPDLDEHVSVLSVVSPGETMPMRQEVIQSHLARNRQRRSARTG
jgi:hypothetical protein